MTKSFQYVGTIGEFGTGVRVGVGASIGAGLRVGEGMSAGAVVGVVDDVGLGVIVVAGAADSLVAQPAMEMPIIASMKIEILVDPLIFLSVPGRFVMDDRLFHFTRFDGFIGWFYGSLSYGLVFPQVYARQALDVNPPMCIEGDFLVFTLPRVFKPAGG
jgi:hypothetical protein